jgi:hypothetical protein
MGIQVRARVVSVTPHQPVNITWRTGGEGLGGAVVRGYFTLPPTDEATKKALGVEGKQYFLTTDRWGMRMWIPEGLWSRPAPLASMGPAGPHQFLTVSVDGMQDREKSPNVLKDLTIELELLQGGKVLKHMVEHGPDGPTATFHIAAGELGPNEAPTPAFIRDTKGIFEYAKDRLHFLRSLPWAKEPVPKRFAIVTDASGYRPGAGYGIRTTDKDVFLTELESVRELGVNGLRQAPDFVYDLIREKKGIGKELSRVRIALGVGYPVSKWDAHKNPGGGCPYNPIMKGYEEKEKAALLATLANTERQTPTEEQWFLEVDEIGSVFDGSAESKSHQSTCPYCRQAFHEFVRRRGLTLADFGAKSWDDVRSTYGYWDKSYAETVAAAASASSAPSAPPPPTPKPAAPVPVAPQAGNPMGPGPMTDAQGRRAPLSERGWALLYYESHLFNAESSSMLLRPQREALEAHNSAKAKALAEGRTTAPEALEPWAYTYALRGVNFLMGSSSLDYFDFYRDADNGFMYETSSRDPRIWHWDSYMCDVGRTLVDRMGKRFGIYIKPHRGAAVQRALTAVSREAKTIFWYTYGPDWAKGDSLAANLGAAASASRAARLLAAAEDVIYDSKWAVPAQIAVVRPRTSEFFSNSASWENGKWVYSALTQSHLPVDALDEGLLETEDLSKYKIIYVSGSHLRVSSAKRLGEWVKAGGVLYTSGWGLTRDEADQPLTIMLAPLGLRGRGAVEFWNDVPRYGATDLAPLIKIKEPPTYATVIGRDSFSGSFPLRVAREVLEPTPDAEVLAHYGDGAPAVVRHRYGKGATVVVGFYAGVEYASDIMKPTYDTSKDLDPSKAKYVSGPALAAGVSPVVECSSPVVEGVLLKNQTSGRLAVSLMNWAFRSLPTPAKWENMELSSVKVDVHHVDGSFHQIVSAMWKKPIPFTRSGDTVSLVIPKLQEGDVLLFE